MNLALLTLAADSYYTLDSEINKVLLVLCAN